MKDTPPDPRAEPPFICGYPGCDTNVTKHGEICCLHDPHEGPRAELGALRKRVAELECEKHDVASLATQTLMGRCRAPLGAHATLTLNEFIEAGGNDCPLCLKHHLATAVAAAREESADLLEAAWGIIANAGGGDWNRETPEWQEATARWRDQYHKRFERAAAAPQGQPNLGVPQVRES